MSPYSPYYNVWLWNKWLFTYRFWTESLLKQHDTTFFVCFVLFYLRVPVSELVERLPSSPFPRSSERPKYRSQRPQKEKKTGGSIVPVSVLPSYLTYGTKACLSKGRIGKRWEFHRFHTHPNPTISTPPTVPVEREIGKSYVTSGKDTVIYYG